MKQRFMQEARAAASLHHPDVCAYANAGELLAALRALQRES